MKDFIAGLLLCVTLLLPSSEARAQEIYPVTSITKEDLGKLGELGEKWTQCGKYFAVADTKEGRTVYFTRTEFSEGKLVSKPNFSYPYFVTTFIVKKLAAPQVAIIRNGFSRYAFKMNKKDYTAGLPCFADGTKT